MKKYRFFIILSMLFVTVSHAKKYNHTYYEYMVENGFEKLENLSFDKETGQMKPLNLSVWKVLQETKDDLNKAAALFPDVKPEVIAACILGENSLNVHNDDHIASYLANNTELGFSIASTLAGKKPEDVSIGLGQIKRETALEVDKLLAEKEGRDPYKNYYNISFKKPYDSYKYAAAIIQDAINAYDENNLDSIKESPEIICTLYNIGKPRKRAKKSKKNNTSPKPNYFGFYIDQNYDMIELEFNKDSKSKKQFSSLDTRKVKGRIQLQKSPTKTGNSKFIEGGNFKVIGFDIDKEMNPWSLIQFEEGSIGWIASSDLTNNTQLSDKDFNILPLQKSCKSSCVDDLKLSHPDFFYDSSTTDNLSNFEAIYSPKQLDETEVQWFISGFKNYIKTSSSTESKKVTEEVTGLLEKCSKNNLDGKCAIRYGKTLESIRISLINNSLANLDESEFLKEMTKLKSDLLSTLKYNGSNFTIPKAIANDNFIFELGPNSEMYQLINNKINELNQLNESFKKTKKENSYIEDSLKYIKSFRKLISECKKCSLYLPRVAYNFFKYYDVKKVFYPPKRSRARQYKHIMSQRRRNLELALKSAKILDNFYELKDPTSKNKDFETIINSIENECKSALTRDIYTDTKFFETIEFLKLYYNMTLGEEVLPQQKILEQSLELISQCKAQKVCYKNTINAEKDLNSCQSSKLSTDDVFKLFCDYSAPFVQKEIYYKYNSLTCLTRNGLTTYSSVHINQWDINSCDNLFLNKENLSDLEEIAEAPCIEQIIITNKNLIPEIERSSKSRELLDKIIYQVDQRKNLILMKTNCQ